jgi:hypothetical protein
MCLDDEVAARTLTQRPALDQVPGGAVSRRDALAGVAALAAAGAAAVTGLVGAGPAYARPAQVPAEVAPGLVVLRRESWAAGLPVPAGLPTEAPGDVRVLLVHHSASTSDYDEAGVADQIRQFHALHTGPDKGWPDVAYNFFVDRFGRIWEGRSGSLDGPVIGDATGGNQGFSQLVCLIGNFQAQPPAPEAVESLSRILGWIAARDGVDVTPGARTSFVSRGSNRWPAGATVDTAAVAGHRDMSQTACPGEAAYALVRGALPALVAQRASELAGPPPTPTPAAPTTAPPAAPPPTTAAPATIPPASPPTTPAPATTAGRRESAAAGDEGGDGGEPAVPLLGAAALAVSAVAVPLAIRRRRSTRDP